MKYMLEQDTDNSGTLDFEEFKVRARDAHIYINIEMHTSQYIFPTDILLNILQVAIKIAQKKLKDLSNHD